MAKTIAIKVDLQGTEAQQKKLAKLEAEVKKLTTRRTELNKALKKGTISLDQYGKEIAKINTKLKANRREMLVARENILGLDSFTKKLGKSFSKLGTSISGAFIGLFAVQKFFQVISDGIKTIEEFEQQMANVKAVTGATEVEFKALTNSAKELGRTSLFTSMEVGELQEELAKLGFTTPEILAASEAILQLATASGSDLAQSAVVSASTLRGFGLEATETQRIVDVMAKSFSSSSLDINKFQTAMAAVAPVAKTAGFSVERTTALLGTLTDAGFDASTAGTGLRNIFLEISKRGITLEEALEQIRSSSDKTTEALELFDKRGAALAITLADNEAKSNDLTKSFNNAQGAAKDMADVMAETSIGATKKLESAFDGLILTISEGSEEGFAAFKNGLADFLNDVSDFVDARNDLLESGVSLTIGDRYFGLDSDQADNLKKIRKEQDFLNKNLKNREVLLERINKLKAENRRYLAEEFSDEVRRKRAADELTDAEEDRVVWVRKQRRINEKALKDLRTQVNTLEEVGKQEEANAKKSAIESEIEGKTQVKITEEVKKTNKELEKLKLTREDINKLAKEELEEVEFDELDDAVEFNEDDYKKASEDKFAFLLEDSKKLGELRDKEQEKDAARFAQDANDKLQQEALLAEQVKEQSILLAEQTANALVDVNKRRIEREKQMELDALDAKVQNGLISQEQFEEQREKIERKAFEKQKRLDIARAIANGAIAVTKTIAQLGGIGAITPLGAASLALVGASTATQVGVIASQKFEDGGILSGPSHANGGIDLGNNQEAEGGEAIINKRSTAMFKPLLSAINEAGGGISFASPNVSSGYFAQGGITQNSSIDTSGLRDEIASAVISSIGAIQVQNVATDTTTEAIKISNIQSEASFG